MKLEVVDKRNAMLIRVTTISDVEYHRLKVSGAPVSVVVLKGPWRCLLVSGSLCAGPSPSSAPGPF